jgi:hypothetical protein
MEVYVDVPSQSLGVVGSSNINGTLVFVVTLTSPPGNHTVCVQTLGPTPASACAQFLTTAFQPRITLSPDSVTQGGNFTAVGSGFPAGEIVGLYYDTLGGTYLSTPGPADSQGGFLQSQSTGSVTPGYHVVCGETGPQISANDQYTAKVCAQLTVLFAPSPSPAATASPDQSPSPMPSPSANPSASPTPIPSPTVAATPAAEIRKGSGFSIWPIAAGAAVVVAGIAGYFIRMRRERSI